MKRILILAGPSAVGKTTVMTQLLFLRQKFEYIRSATTRAPRGDGHDSEYIYLSEEEFAERIKNGKMLEYTNFGGNLYGTPQSEIERIFNAGKIPVLILDINGTETLKSKKCDFEVFAVYMIEDTEILDRRLYERAVAEGKSDKAIQTYERRKAQNRADLDRISELKKLFDFVLKNDDVADTAEKILFVFEK